VFSRFYDRFYRRKSHAERKPGDKPRDDNPI
jgi:hypothetical protein